MTTKKYLIAAVIAVIFITLVLTYYRKRNKNLDELLDYENYEGDNYTGQQSYVGDKDFYENDFGRQNAVAVKSSLYKVIEPAYKLRLEKKDGKKVLVREGDNVKFNRGAQIRIIDTTVSEPLIIHGQAFGRDIKGIFIRLDKVKKIRD